MAQETPHVLYFDAFGNPPPREVSLRAKREGRGVLYPDIMVQSPEEVNCGPRTLGVLSDLAQAAQKGEELDAFGQLAQA